MTHLTRRWAVITAAAAMILGTLVTSASAVTDGELDGDAHPYVGLMVAFGAPNTDGSPHPLWRCTGTLISPKVFLTAGHCTESPALTAQIWFDADLRDAALHNYPLKGDVSGTVHTHPDFYTANFTVHDVGVVTLDKDFASPNGVYGQLPTLNELDKLKTARGQQNVTFTAVGYGLQEAFPVQSANNNVAQRIRLVANPKLNQINVPGFTGDYSLLLSNNAKTGGTCFGDSGGPNFLQGTNVIAGVTSFGINGNCAGTGGVFRMDRASAQDWVKSFL